MWDKIDFTVQFLTIFKLTRAPHKSIFGKKKSLRVKYSQKWTFSAIKCEDLRIFWIFEHVY